MAAATATAAAAAAIISLRERRHGGREGGDAGKKHQIAHDENSISNPQIRFLQMERSARGRCSWATGSLGPGSSATSRPRMKAK